MSRLRILVVEDDEDIRTTLHDRLQKIGFDVITENSGHLVLSRIELEISRSPIHGVLLDLHLPIVDGITVLRELRHHHPQIPVIVMSAQTTQKNSSRLEGWVPAAI